MLQSGTKKADLLEELSGAGSIFVGKWTVNILGRDLSSGLKGNSQYKELGDKGQGIDWNK